MKILIASATKIEVDPLYLFLKNEGIQLEKFKFRFKNNTVHFLITGPGSVNMAFNISMLTNHPYDLAINAGIGGSFNKNNAIGAVFNVTADRFADLGTEETDGSFLDIFDMNLLEKNEFPYINGWLHTNIPAFLRSKLLTATGITVNKITGTTDSANKLFVKYNPEIESMEGAGFIFACNKLEMPSIQIRSISNYVGPRDRSEWRIPESIKSLNISLIEMIHAI